MSGIVSSPLSDAQAEQILESIRRRFHLVLTSPTQLQPGQPLTAAVIPSLQEIDASDLATGVLNLAGVVKDVLFDDTNPVSVPTPAEVTNPSALDGDNLAKAAARVVGGQPLSRPLDGTLNLAWTAKDVVFKNPNVMDVPSGGSLEGDALAAAANVAGGEPFPPPAPILNGPTTPSVSNVLGTLGQLFGGIGIKDAAPPPATPTVPGLLGQLFGTVGLPQLKVQVKVRWVVRDTFGKELKDGEDFIAAQGLSSPTVTMLLQPTFQELRLDTMRNPGGSIICLSAMVTLSLGAKTLDFTVSPVPVLLLPLLIPTVVMLFSEPNFGLSHDSAVLIIVPKHSPFASAEPLFKMLKKIEAIISALRGLGGMASFFLGLDELLGTVPDQPRLRFIAADEIPKLGDIIIKRRPWYHVLGEDPSFDDRVSSLIIFGKPGTRVQFFNDTNFKTSPATKQGNFDIKLGNVAPELDYFVAVRTLDTDDNVKPETFPQKQPNLPNSPDRVARFEPDTKGGDNRWHTDMSSVRFFKDWLDDIAGQMKTPLEKPPLICGLIFPPPKPR